MSNLLDMISSWRGALFFIGSFLSIIVITKLCEFLYNIFLHPLSSYPGPKLWAGSRLFLFRHILRGESIYQLKRLHDQYGPVVRVAPTELSYVSASAWKAIYGHRSIEMPKALDGRGGLQAPPKGGYNIITANRANHIRMRRNVTHAFSEKALREQESYLQKYVSELITRLRESATSGKPQDIAAWYNFTTFDVIGDLAFGESFGCVSAGDYHPWVVTIIDMIRAIPWGQFSLYYNLSTILRKIITPSGLEEARVKNYELAAEKMNRRVAIKEDRKDFTSFMLRHSDDEKALSVDELQKMGTTLINAGSETTASALSGTTFGMLTTRHTYDKAVKEIRERFGKEDEITMLAVTELPYLNAMLEEGLRLHPPIPNVLPRVVPGQGESIDGKWVPGNTAVGVPHYAAYRSASNFRRPTEFVPERWLPDQTEFADDDKSVFQPFSFGPRNCIGRNLAWAEMRLIIANILFNFDLELMDESRDWDMKRTAPFLWDKTPMMVKLTVR